MNVIEIPLYRSRMRNRIAFRSDPPPAVVPRIAHVLALAHAMRAVLERGEAKSHGDLALATGFTRARITQLLDLTLLAPDIQEQLVFGNADVPVRALRRMAIMSSWQEQRSAFARLLITIDRGSGRVAK